VRYSGKVFVINLDRSPDRWRFMREQADILDVDIERVPAVDGVAVPETMRWEFLSSTGAIHSKLSKGEVGCYASHLVVYQRIIDAGMPHALVLEDDSVLPDDIMQIAGEAVARCPGNWDIIHLSSVLKKRKVVPIAALGQGRHIVRHTRLPVNTWGYLVSRAGAQKLRKPGLRVRPIDMEFRYAWVRDLEIYGVSPTPIRSQEQFGTTIDADWRTKPVRRGQWAPSLKSRLYGELYKRRRTFLAVMSLHSSRVGALRGWLGAPRSETAG
jgi:glycosyl transferase, family 25